MVAWGETNDLAMMGEREKINHRDGFFFLTHGGGCAHGDVCIRVDGTGAAQTCVSKLIPCAQYLNATTKPPNSCCDPIKEAVATDLQCMCNLYENPAFLSGLGINVAQALRLPQLCGISYDTTTCNNTTAFPLKKVEHGDKLLLNGNRETLHDSITETLVTDDDKAVAVSEVCDASVYDIVNNDQPSQRQIPNAILPLLRYQQYDSSESSLSLQGSPSEDRNFRSELDSAEMEETSFSSQEDSEHDEILDWAKDQGLALRINTWSHHIRTFIHVGKQ
ncbi:unnamed protein product [Lactuca virosa]|uniref:Bifunctional inhibitor/plant lipid transfer protein/seed storage helical domain-containing protein n=1 Tax=Lactuca virosa TaxID=75947 RepID=A0AAU9PUG0_9ASTR|nr:unnamed protein product [Lactuca virosa]